MQQWQSQPNDRSKQMSTTRTNPIQFNPNQAQTNRMTHKLYKKTGNCSTVQRANDLMIEN